MPKRTRDGTGEVDVAGSRMKRAFAVGLALVALPVGLAMGWEMGGAESGERTGPGRLSPAQDAEAQVRAAVQATVEAWSQGDFEAFAAQYHDDVRGFFLDGAALARGFDIAALRMAYEAGLTASVSVRDVDVRVYDRTAVVVAYLDGSINLPAGAGSIGGTWRYSETRIREDDAWRVVQYHISELGGGP